MTHRISIRSDAATLLAGALFGLSLQFMIKAYFGIDHDSVLYLGEILRLRMPEQLSQDLFFLHGSQGSYTLLPHLVAALPSAIDLPALFMAATVIGLLLFAAASWLALRAIVPPGQRYWPWLALLCLPATYGAYRIFSYGEPFFTPRLYAEPLCLVAVAWLTERRIGPALICLGLAGLLHPLQALGAALIAWAWLVLDDRRWLHALWSIPVILILAWTGIPPFSGLLLPLDPATLQLARIHSAHLFLEHWRAADYQTLIFDGLLLTGGLSLTPVLRRWAAACLIGLGLSLLATYLLTDQLHLTLPTALQLWRSHWLAHWFAMALVGVFLQRDLQARDTQRVLLLILCILLGYGEPGWLWLPVWGAYLGWPRLLGRVRPALQVWILLGTLLAITLFFLDYLGTIAHDFREAHYQLARYPLDRAFFTFPALSLGLALAVILLWQRGAAVIRASLVIAGLLPLMTYAAARWDARPALYKALETHAFQPTLFGHALPPHAQVYWAHASSVANWLVINRPDYYSPQQLSGAIFSPGLASDAQARIARLRPLFKGIETCIDPRLDTDSRRRCRLPEAALRRACALDTSPAPPPDYLVLPYPQQAPVLGTWSVTDPTADIPVLTFRLYACRDIRAAAPTNRASAPGLSNLSQTPG